MAAENQDTNLSQGQPTQPKPIIPKNYRHLKQLRESSVPVKTSWPELVGLTVEEAEKKIKEEIPYVNIQVVQPDHFITHDYRLDRVRFYVDSSAKIVKTPSLG